MRNLAIVLIGALIAAWSGVAAAEPVCAQVEGSASCEGAAVSVLGDASCTGVVPVFALHTCVAASGAGGADACREILLNGCVAASGTGDSTAGGAAASGVGASRGDLALAPGGDANGRLLGV